MLRTTARSEGTGATLEVAVEGTNLPFSGYQTFLPLSPDESHGDMIFELSTANMATFKILFLTQMTSADQLVTIPNLELYRI